jgi:hypothetical protein
MSVLSIKLALGSVLAALAAGTALLWRDYGIIAALVDGAMTFCMPGL